MLIGTAEADELKAGDRRGTPGLQSEAQGMSEPFLIKLSIAEQTVFSKKNTYINALFLFASGEYWYKLKWLFFLSESKPGYQ